MVHTHQSRGLRFQLESCCVTDCMTHEVLALETSNPPEPAPKRYEYRSFAEALKIPMFGSAFSAVTKLYCTLRRYSFLFFCFSWFWATLVVSFAKLADSIFWVRLFLILVDSTIFKVIVCLRQKYPVLGTEWSELILAVKNTLENYRKLVASTGLFLLLKLLATGKLHMMMFIGIATLCDKLTTFLDKFENLVDYYFPIEPVYSRPSSSGCSSGGDDREGEAPVVLDDGGGLNEID